MVDAELPVSLMRRPLAPSSVALARDNWHSRQVMRRGHTAPMAMLCWEDGGQLVRWRSQNYVARWCVTAAA